MSRMSITTGATGKNKVMIDELQNRISGNQDSLHQNEKKNGFENGNPERVNTGRLQNPLPDPVPGRREVLEFPITDGEEDRTSALAASSADYPDREDLEDAREDDFDIRISGNDDFDFE